MFRPRATLVGVLLSLVLIAGMSSVAFADTGPTVVAGYKDGPITLEAGKSPSAIASLSLTGGRWVAWAKLYVVQTTNQHAANVICTLRGPGSSSPVHRMEVTVGGNQDGGIYNQPIALETDLVIPKGGGNATLRCSASGKGSNVAAQQIKIMAMSVSKVTSVNLANGDTSTVGTGTPAVIVGAQAGPITLPASTNTVVGDVTLPAGSWWLRSIVDLTETDNDGGSCWLTVGSSDQDRLNFRRANGRTQAVVFDTAIRLANPAHARITCTGYPISGVLGDYVNQTIRNARIVAVKVGTLTLLDSGQNFGSGPPQVRYATSGNVSYNVGSPWAPINPTLDVAAGDWMFLAKADVYGTAPLVRCELRALPDYDRDALGGNGDLTMPFQVVHHFDKAGSARIYCHTVFPTETPAATAVHIAGFRLGSLVNVAMP